MAMSKSGEKGDPETIRKEIVRLLDDFELQLGSDDLRRKVQALIPALHKLRSLGSSLLPGVYTKAARDRILYYFRKYPLTAIHGDEITLISGIQEWARRIRELRVQFGWPIVNGKTVKEMAEEDELSLALIDPASVGPDHYVLLDQEQDRKAAHRWHVANEIRRLPLSVRDRILLFLRRNVGEPLTGEELRYVAKDRTEWARRVRELRTELGWSVVTKSTGKPNLPIGTYLLEADRQSPQHDRQIPDPLRRLILRRDEYRCRKCRWSHDEWNPSDPRHLELHHLQPHAEGGPNTEANLVTLCTVCHDLEHS